MSALRTWFVRCTCLSSLPVMEEKEMGRPLGMRLRALNELIEAEKQDIVGRIEPEDGDMRHIVVRRRGCRGDAAEARGNKRKKLVPAAFR